MEVSEIVVFLGCVRSVYILFCSIYLPFQLVDCSYAYFVVFSAGLKRVPVGFLFTLWDVGLLNVYFH